MEGNGWEEDDFSVIPEASDITGSVSEPQGTNEVNTAGDTSQTQDVQPVNMGKKKTGFIFILFLIVVALILLIVRNLSLTKKSEISAENYNVVNGGEYNTQNTVSKGAENASEISVNTPENQVSVGVGEADPSMPTTGISEVNTTESVTSTESVAVENTTSEEVAVVQQGTINEGVVPDEAEPSNEFNQLTLEPALGAEIQATGMVKGLYMYQIGNSYTYGVNLVIITGNDMYIECYYFCPRKTYSALAIGDSLQITYQQDSMGNVSVVSISK